MRSDQLTDRPGLKRTAAAESSARDDSRWDDDDGFYYDVLHLPDGTHTFTVDGHDHRVEYEPAERRHAPAAERGDAVSV